MKTHTLKKFISIGRDPWREANVHLSNTWSLLIGIILSLLSGVLLTLSFSPYNHWYFVFIAFVPMALSQYRILPKKYTALASGITNMTWLALYFGPMFFFVPEAPIYMKLLPIIGLVLALLTEKGFRGFHHQTGYRWFVLHGVANWVWFEFIRTFIPGLGTWGFVGYTLWSQTWLLFPISIVGIYGLSLLIMFMNYSLTAFIISLLDKKVRLYRIVPITQKIGTGYLLIALGLSILWIGSGLILQNKRVQEIERQDRIQVVAIQPGTTEVAFSHPEMDSMERLSLLIEMTRESKEDAPRLVVWPELVLNFDPELYLTEDLKALAHEMEAYLVLPYGLLENQEMRNEARLLSPEGVFYPLYSKTHPVAFAGERRGPNWGVFPTYTTSFGEMAIIICYDLNYLDVTRTMAKRGAQIIAVPSNDWPGIVEKQNIHLIFRAIENNVSFVKAENAYQSIVISPLGEIVSETRSYQPRPEILTASVKLGTPTPTLYSQLGDLVGWILFILGFFFMWMESYVHKTTKKREMKKDLSFHQEK